MIVLAMFYVGLGDVIISPLLTGYHFSALSLFGLILVILISLYLLNHGYLIVGITFWYLSSLTYFILLPETTPSGYVLNILIALISIPTAFMIGFLLAVGRANHSIITLRFFCVGLVKLIRGIPLLGLLFFVITVGSKLIPESWIVSSFTTAWMTISLFAGVYLSDIFYAGLRAYPKQLDESALSLGFTPFQALRLIKLPWVIQKTLPSATNIYVGLFKETSLLLILGLYDLLGVMQNTLNTLNQESLTIYFYLYVGVCFWIGAKAIHTLGRHIMIK